MNSSNEPLFEVRILTLKPGDVWFKRDQGPFLVITTISPLIYGTAQLVMNDKIGQSLILSNGRLVQIASLFKNFDFGITVNRLKR